MKEFRQSLFPILGRKRWGLIALAGMSISYNRLIFLAQPVFFVALLRDLGTSTIATAGVFSMASIAHVLGAVVAGALLLRWPTLAVIGFGVFLSSLGLIGSSLTSSLGVLYVIYGVFLGFGRALFGYLPTSSLLTTKFPERRGAAMGIVFSMAGLISGVLMPLIQRIIDMRGWRYAMANVGICGVIILGPIFLYILIRNRRAKVITTRSIKSGTSRIHLTSMRSVIMNIRTITRAVNQRSLVLLIVAWVFLGFSIASVIVPFVAHLDDRGIPPNQGAVALSSLAFATSIGSLAGGPLSDRIGREVVYTIASTLKIVGLVALLAISGEHKWLLAVFVALYGLGWGSTTPLEGTIVADLFPNHRLYPRLGMLEALIGLSYAGGAAFAGFLRDVVGTYVPAILLAIASLVIVTISYWLAAPRNALS